MKVKVISLPYIFQVLYVLCFTRPRYQVSVYRTIGPLVIVMYQSFVITSPNLMEAAKRICRVLYCFCSQRQMPNVLYGQTLHCIVKHSILRWETVVGLSTGYLPGAINYLLVIYGGKPAHTLISDLN